MLIACGGTGGHLFPGIAVAQALQADGHEPLLMISGKRVDQTASEKYENLRFVKVEMMAKPRTFSLAMVKFVFRTFSTIAQCKRLLKEEKIDAVLGMGGFTSYPPVVAAAKTGRRAYVHDSNVVPGRSNLLTAKKCTKVLVGLKEAASAFGDATVEVTGTPVRDELEELPTKEAARERFGLRQDRPVVLVMGGSQGARRVNELVVEAAVLLPDVQFLHLTGEADFERVQDQVGDRENYVTQAFCDEMPLAYQAADFCVARSGASSLTELAHVGLPALLVPYPYAADDHQTANAEVFEKAGAAILKQESELSAEGLKGILEGLDEEKVLEMGAKMREMSVPDAAERIAAVVLQK